MNKVKSKIFFNLLFFVFLTTASLYVGQNYLVKRVEALSSEIISTKKEFNKLENRNGKLIETRRDYDDIGKEIENISDVVVDDDKIVDFIEEVEKVAAEDGVKLRISSTSDSKGVKDKEGYISQKSFSLIAAGDFNGIMHFLYSLENFDYYVNVEDINIGFGDFDEHNKDLIMFSANIKVYQKTK
jgi:Tfp pilus assembly protein PilO